MESRALTVEPAESGESFPHAARERPRILVVEHEGDAGLQRLRGTLLGAGNDIHEVGPFTGREIPTDLEPYDALIVLGGTPGPTEDDVAPWLPATRGLVSQALADEKPYLGVCLGAQILAVVAGGAVGEAEHPEIGLTDFALTEAAAGDPLLDGLDAVAGPLRAMQWHFLEVTELPPGSRSLAGNDACANQAFRVGPSAWGVQFHLEADAATARDWAEPERTRPELAERGLTAAGIIEDMEANDARLAATWGALVRRWIDIVQEPLR